MTNAERNAVAAAGLVTVLWAGGLFAAYVLRAAPPPPTLAGPSPSSPASPAPAVAVPGLATIAGPPVVATVAATGLPTLAEKRDRLEQGPTVDGGPLVNNPHGRWESRTGTVLPPPPGFEATPVTVHLRRAAARQALVQVGHAAGAQLVAFPSNIWVRVPFPATVTLDADNQPMMEVVAELSAKLGLAGGRRTTNNWGGGPATTDPFHPCIGLQQQDAGGGLGPWVVTGPFAFEVQRVSHVAPIADAPANNGGLLTVLMTMQHEPGVVVLGQQGVTVTAATDEAGHPLGIAPPSPPPPAPPRGKGGLSLFGGLLRFGHQSTMVAGAASPTLQSADEPMSIPLACPPDVGRRIARLDLTVRLLIADRSERVEAPVGTAHPAAVDRSAAGLGLTIGPIDGNEQNAYGQVTYKRAGQSDAEWAALRAVLGQVVPVLLDADGRLLPAPQNSYVTTADDQLVTVNTQWFQQPSDGGDPPVRPARLAVNVPVAMRAVDVPIEFHDLPLP